MGQVRRNRRDKTAAGAYAVIQTAARPMLQFPDRTVRCRLFYGWGEAVFPSRLITQEVPVRENLPYTSETAVPVMTAVPGEV